MRTVPRRGGTDHVRDACWGPAQGGYEELLLNTHLPAFFVFRSLLMTFGFCSRGVSQWVVPAPVVQWAIAISVGSGCLPTIKLDESAVQKNADRCFFAGIPQCHTTLCFNWVYKSRSTFQKLYF